MRSLNKTQMSHPSFILKVLAAMAQALRSRDPFKSQEFIHNRKGQRIALLVWTDKAPGRFLLWGTGPRDEHSDLMVSIIEDCGNTLHLQWLKELQEHARMKLLLRLEHEEAAQKVIKERLMSTFSLVQVNHLMTAAEVLELRLRDELQVREALQNARSAFRHWKLYGRHNSPDRVREIACEAIAWYRQAGELLSKSPAFGRMVEPEDVRKFQTMRQVVGMGGQSSATGTILSWHRGNVIKMDYSDLETRTLAMLQTGCFGFPHGPFDIYTTGTGRSITQ